MFVGMLEIPGIVWGNLSAQVFLEYRADARAKSINLEKKQCTPTPLGLKVCHCLMYYNGIQFSCSLSDDSFSVQG